jgi:glyoxylase-like metal-dependent hydrolase (beta-lactamase superfamily II)
MENLPIPEHQAIPIDDIAPGVRGLRIAFVNVFAVTHADGSWTLVDAALPFTGIIIQQWAKRVSENPPNAIVLTHGHFDHVSAARELADQWNVSIYAHPLEAPYLKGIKEYPRPNVRAGGGAMSLLSPLYPRGPVDLGGRLRLLQPADSSELTELRGWQVLHSPGHTEGHISLFRPEDRCLIVGDAFCTTKPESFFDAAITKKPELHGPPAYFTSDWVSAGRSVERLASINPLTVAPGHGRPLRGGNLPAQLHQLAWHFREIAVPENRRDSAA